MTCKSDVEIGLIGASYLIGYSAAILWMPGFADKYGRKKFFLLAMFIDIGLYVAMFFTTNYAFMVFIQFAFGFMSPLRINVGYVYLMELMPAKV